MPDETAQQPKKRQHRKAELRVVFDTNALYVTPTSPGSASDLVRHEIADLVKSAKYPDLDILWYLPEVVRHERQYQMQSEALKLRSAINRIERLLDHNLALTDETLLAHVATKIEGKKRELGLQELALDSARVDWKAVVHAASYRLPPFNPGEKEKGFRDAIVVESFMQLVADSPKTPKVCRVVLITSDELLTVSVKERISSFLNVGVLADIEELKGLINTLISDVDEAFIASLQPKAARLFFISSDNQDTLYYREHLMEQIESKFTTALSALPEKTAFRNNIKWYISRPNFARKEGKRIFWNSRIEVEVEAGILKTDSQPTEETLSVYTSNYPWTKSLKTSNLASIVPPTFGSDISPLLVAGSYPLYTTINPYISALAAPAEKQIVTHQGRDVYQVSWSADVTLAKELKKAIIEEITHIGLNCQQVA
jgi:hypothetical protein